MHIIIKLLRIINKKNLSKQNSCCFFSSNKMSSYNQGNYQQQATLSNKFRRWNNVSDSQNNNKDVDFILGSYNILADKLYKMHNYLYCEHDQNALNWNHRFNRIMIEILSAKPQVLCLQEVQYDHLEQIVRGLKSLNFDFLYKKRTGNKPDGCAVLYNKNLFNLVEYHNVEFEQPGIDLLDRENVAILAKLSLKTNPSMEFVVATTHLLYNPRRQDIRLVQIQILLAELDRISKIQNNEANVPVILTGDFNLQPNTAPYNLLTKGNLHYENLQQRTLSNNNSNKVPNGRKLLPIKLGITDSCQHFNIIENKISKETKLYHSEKCNLSGFKNRADVILTKDVVELFETGVLKHGFDFKSVYYPPDNFASTHQDDWVLVDYIFFTASQSKNAVASKNIAAELKLLSYLNLPSPVECTQIGKIPNIYFGSDHMSLFAKFRIQPIRNFSTTSSSNLTGHFKGQL